MSGFQLQRLGMLMEPEPGNPLEAEGVLNPAAVRGPDGKLYLFPRLVARAIIRASALPGFGSMRLATRPSRAARHCAPASSGLRRRSDGSGGCEDARVTYVEPLQHYVMTYTALSPSGPGLPWPCRRICSTGSGSGWRPLNPFKALISSMWTTGRQHLPVAIPNHAGKMQLPSFTPSFSRHPPRGNRLPG